MEPMIRNISSFGPPGDSSFRMIWLDDNPPTCTMTYSEIKPGKTSVHHIHPWEHQVYIVSGAGTLICDGKNYPVRDGDGLFIPPNVDHYTLNDGGQGDIHRIEINPLIAAQSGGVQNDGGTGTGQPPVIRNHRDLDMKVGHELLGSKDGAPNYLLLYNGPMAPGKVTHPDTNGHNHAWEHSVFVLEGQATLVCDGKEYTVSQGDAILVPPTSQHQWRNNSDAPMTRVTFNPLSSEGHG